MCTHTKKLGKLSQAFCLRVLKRVLFCFLSHNQCNLLATYPAPISTIFEIKDVNVNWCVHAYTSEKNWNFCTGDFPGAKNS